MKTAFITGGSSGLGLEMAKQLASRGYHSIIMARNESRVEKAAQIIRETGGMADGFAGSITDSDALENVAEKIKKKFGGIDFLILNAGVVHVKSLVDYKNVEEMKSDIEIDLWGTVLSAFHFVPLLNPGAKVLIVSSVLGLDGFAGYSTYCAAKAGLITFGKTLRRELLYKKIPVYVACPADIDTPQYEYEFDSKPQWMQKPGALRPKVVPPETVAAKILKKCFGKRFLIFSDPASLALFLSSKLLPSRLMAYIIDKAFPIPMSDRP